MAGFGVEMLVCNDWTVDVGTSSGVLVNILSSCALSSPVGSSTI